MLKVLVIGGSSFIGRNFVTYAAKHGLNICATYFQDNAFRDFVRDYADIESVKIDVTKDAPIKSFDTCLYLAGNSNHALAFENPGQDLTMNALGLVRFLEGADHFKSFIILSSGAVYHGHRGFVSPRTPLAPEHAYGISKMAEESYVRFFTRTGKIENHLILRLYHCFGPFEASRRIMARLLDAFVLRGAKEFTVDGDGTTLMDVLYIDELVRLLYNAITTQQFRNETLDVCSGSPLTLFELARNSAQALDIYAKISANPQVRIEPILYWSQPEANTRFLSSNERVSLKDGVKRYAVWLSDMRRQISW